MKINNLWRYPYFSADRVAVLVLQGVILSAQGHGWPVIAGAAVAAVTLGMALSKWSDER